jgi:hypothetical protein
MNNQTGNAQALSDEQIEALFNDIRIAESGWSNTREQTQVVLKFARTLLAAQPSTLPDAMQAQCDSCKGSGIDPTWGRQCCRRARNECGGRGCTGPEPSQEPCEECGGGGVVAIQMPKAGQAAQPLPAQAPLFDLDAIDWKRIKSAASESKWMPPEYMRNDWVYDVCEYLRNGFPQPAAQSADNFTGLAHELWAAAQLLPNDGIEDGVARIDAILKKQSAGSLTAHGPKNTVLDGLDAALAQQAGGKQS